MAIYQNGKEITPKLNGKDLSRVMYNGKKIWPTEVIVPRRIQFKRAYYIPRANSVGIALEVFYPDEDLNNESIYDDNISGCDAIVTDKNGLSKEGSDIYVSFSKPYSELSWLDNGKRYFNGRYIGILVKGLNPNTEYIVSLRIRISNSDSNKENYKYYKQYNDRIIDLNLEGLNDRFTTLSNNSFSNHQWFNVDSTGIGKTIKAIPQITSDPSRIKSISFTIKHGRRYTLNGNTCDFVNLVGDKLTVEGYADVYSTMYSVMYGFQGNNNIDNPRVDSEYTIRYNYDSNYKNGKACPISRNLFNVDSNIGEVKITITQLDEKFSYGLTRSTITIGSNEETDSYEFFEPISFAEAIKTFKNVILNDDPALVNAFVTNVVAEYETYDG